MNQPTTPSGEHLLSNMPEKAAVEATAPPSSPPAAKTIRVALIGNPNTGKTTLFNALCGLRQKTGNYPGVTVEIRKGYFHYGDHTFEVVDLPGTYSLSPRSPDEMLAVELVLGLRTDEPAPDVLLSIVDASNLERNLYLTCQLFELGKPVVLALNMMDLVERQGKEIDVVHLQERLGVLAVPMKANRKIGLEALRESLLQAAAGKAPPLPKVFPEPLERELVRLADWLRERLGLQNLASSVHVEQKCQQQLACSRFLLQRLLLDVGGSVERRVRAVTGEELTSVLDAARQRLAEQGIALAGLEPRARYSWLRERLRGCVHQVREPATNWTDRIDRLLTHKVYGTLIFLALMLLVFWSIFSGAEPVMHALEYGITRGGEFLADLFLPQPGMLRSLFLDGVIKGVGSVLMFLPQIMILFGFIAVLEDCGYMARAAFLMDKLMARCGLSGKSFIPLLSSFACAIPGIMATRVIEDRRDRLATILIAPLMSCSARLPVYNLMIAAFITTQGFLGHLLPALVLLGMYLIGITLAPLVAWALKRTVLQGETPIFLLELPPYQIPSLRLIAYRMVERGWAFVRRAGTLILASMVLIWALLYFPRTGPDHRGNEIDYEATCAELRERLDSTEDHATKERLHQEYLAVQGQWRRNSWLGRAGRWLEPLIRPLGWDWRIGMAALASFPAREVVVGTLGIIFDVGEDFEGEAESRQLRQQLQLATWQDGSGKPLFTVSVALSLMVFFALCSQCVSTLAVIRRETNSWGWPVFTFFYMTILAYLGALLVYQVGKYIG
ncbi:MAG: ferrous iron transport protein B [Gemmatales bacterium]|nr:ferrous iron transport protein B [Gemmatales bacterium]MDW8174824.1 ferrous iron transport protein B [Gemmatales bacterium]